MLANGLAFVGVAIRPIWRSFRTIFLVEATVSLELSSVVREGERGRSSPLTISS
jgi:hypothetical protein